MQTSFNEPPNSMEIDAEKIFSQFTLTEEQQNNFERVLHKFDKYFIPHKNRFTNMPLSTEKASR